MRMAARSGRSHVRTTIRAMATEQKGTIMKTIIAASLGMMMLLSGAALGQSGPAERVPARPVEPEASDRVGFSRDRSALIANPTDVPADIPVVKAKRSYGPDLMALIFAPVGQIVAPINQGLHTIDAAVAPINTALRPITGPLAVPGEPALIPAPEAPLGPRK